MIASQNLRLTAAMAAVLATAPAAQAQGFDFFHRQPPQAAQTAPPADIPGEAGGDANEAAAHGGADQPARGRAEAGERPHRGIGERSSAGWRTSSRSSGRTSNTASASARASPPPRPRSSPGRRPAAAPPVVIEAPVTVRPRKSDAFDPNAEPNAPGAPQPLGTTAPSAPLVRPVPPAGPPLELGRGPAPAPPPATGPTIVGTGVAMLDAPREQFNAALQAFQNGQYQQAEDGFKAFMAANAGHRLTADAIFYIGETYFQRSRPREAAEQYLKVTTDYARSSRAPESMVRLGQALAALGNSGEACATFAEFGKRYPNATQSVKKLAEREMAKDHC